MLPEKAFLSRIVGRFERTRAVRLVAAAALLAALAACSTTMYMLQAADGEWRVLRARKPIVEVIDDPDTPEQVVKELGEVREARTFASKELGLPNNSSYHTYVDLHRPYVVWNVVAAPALSVQPRQWCFPIAGCVAYRGYFHESSARAYARHLARHGYDVVVEGVPAYSTLGWFPDPVMSTMMRYGSVELAATIFHELAHQLLYVPNDSRFDEAFADTVEEAGLKRWLEYRGEPQRIRIFERDRADEHRLVDLLRRTRDRLARLYASDRSRSKQLADKRRIFARLGRGIEALERRLGVRFPVYDQWIARGLNNAELASVDTYYDCSPGFERLLEKEHGNLPRFYAAARKLAHEPMQERDAAVCSTT